MSEGTTNGTARKISVAARSREIVAEIGPDCTREQLRQRLLDDGYKPHVMCYYHAMTAVHGKRPAKASAFLTNIDDVLDQLRAVRQLATEVGGYARLRRLCDECEALARDNP